jgi:hypothetical protein
LNYATNNRNEWERKGKEAIKGYVKQYLADEDVDALKELTSKQDNLMTDKAASSLALPHSHIISPGQA